MPGQAVVTIRDKQWQCTIASTPQEWVSGLGGVESIPPGTGMLFDTGWEQIIQVTTVPMLFPIDIAFLSESLVVTEVYLNVEPGFIVTPTVPARYFLEVNASELEGIESGDVALIKILSLAETPSTADWMPTMMTFLGFMVMGMFMVAIVKDLVKNTLETEKKSLLYGPRGERLLPQTKSAARYEIETDRMGNIIITRSDDPGKDVFLQFESDKELVYGMLQKGERKDLDAGWPIRIKRTEPRASTLDELWESSAQPQKSPQTRKQKICRSDVSVDSWQERDRLGIWITDRHTDKVIAEWWDDDARQMFEDGFFKPGKQLSESVLDYAESVGLLAGGKYLALTVKDAFYWTAINKDTGEIDENYTPYTGSSRAMRSGKAFVSRHWQGLALVEVWKQPGRYSEGLKIEPVASEKVVLGKAPAVIPAKGKPTGTCYADAWRFLIKEEEGTLIHGTVFSGGRRIGHAWVETSTGWVWEPETGRYFTRLGFRDTFAPEIESRYTAEEAAIMAARTKNLGPWSELERRQHLQGKSPAVISTEPRQRRPKPDELEYLPDSPEFLAYTIDDIGYRDRIDSAFLNAIKRAKGGQ